MTPKTCARHTLKIIIIIYRKMTLQSETSSLYWDLKYVFHSAMTVLAWPYRNKNTPLPSCKEELMREARSLRKEELMREARGLCEEELMREALFESGARGKSFPLCNHHWSSLAYQGWCWEWIMGSISYNRDYVCSYLLTYKTCFLNAAQHRMEFFAPSVH